MRAFYIVVGVAWSHLGYKIRKYIKNFLLSEIKMKESFKENNISIKKAPIF